MVGKQVTGSLALTVHGPAGVIDLMVPPEALAVDVAAEYAAQCRLGAVPTLHTRRGVALAADQPLSSAGLHTGAVLVASGALRRGDPGPAPRRRRTTSSAGPAAWFALAAGLAAVAGWCTTQATGTLQDTAILLLALSALIGVLPVGRLAGHRVVAAPAFGAAAAYALAWSPAPERLPTVLGAAALGAALTAAVGRALDRDSDEALRVWIISGVAFFVVASGAALVGWGPQAVWAVLLVAAMLAARLVPGVAVDVPDHHLLDLERLAVTAWSARDRPTGRRGRTVVPVDAVAEVAVRGARLLTAASAAIWAVVAVAAPLLLATASLPIDRIGARVMVLLVGAALLLAARSYRHVAARALLRGAGLTCWVALLVVLLDPGSPWRSIVPTVAVILLAGVLVLVAVATGRGWRSAQWSRRAEVAEALVGSGALAATVVAVGLFRGLWELKFRV